MAPLPEVGHPSISTEPVLIASGTTLLWACPPPLAGRSHPGSRGSFFERLEGFGILGMMPGARRQPAEPHGPQFPAQGLRADRHAKLLEHPLRQIDEPPAHHAMDRRDRTAL